MNDDLIILLVASLIFWATLVYHTFKFGNKTSLLVHGLLNISYTAYCLYGLLYDSEGGSGLVWWFYWLVLTGIHWLLLLLTIAYNEFKSKP